MHPDTTDSTRFYEMLAWLELHKKQVLIGTGCLVALGMGLYVYAWSRDQAERAGSKALLALRAVASGNEDKPVAPASEFLKVAREHDATSAGERALLLAAGSLFADSKYAEAQQQFEQFLRQYAGRPLAPIAQFGVASCLDALDQTNAAMAAYRKVIASYPNDAVADRAKLGLASLHEASNQPDQALKIYDELRKPATLSGAANEATLRREVLLRKHPNLAPTNAPAALAALPAAPKQMPTNVPATNPPASKTTPAPPRS